MPDTHSSPKPTLRLIDAIVLIIGIVVGAGIFRTPSVVASHAPDNFWFLTAWLLGGVISLVGALCYSELSSAFPNAGGDYHFLKLAYGKNFSFLFAWSRVTVTQTGSIAILAYIAGDYLSQLFPLGVYSSTYYSIIIIFILTLINILGIKFGTGIQKFLLSLQLICILIIVFAGLLTVPVDTIVINELLTGINGSSELKTGSKKMALVLILSILIITVIYLLINMAFLRVLGLEGIASSDAVGVDMMRATLGEKGVFLIGILVVLSALSSLNTTIFIGARTNYALGKDFVTLSFLGKWNSEKSAPVNSLILQGAIAITLVIFGAFTRNGFESMVDFTAPVFWFFFLFTGISLFVLRKKYSDTPRPFKVPLYPLTPIIFVVFCAYMLYSSLTFTGIGSLVGIVILFLGWFFSLIFRIRKQNK